MDNPEWPLALVLISLIWAVAWVLRARFEFGPFTQDVDPNQPESEEEE